MQKRVRDHRSYCPEMSQTCQQIALKPSGEHHRTKETVGDQKRCKTVERGLGSQTLTL